MKAAAITAMLAMGLVLVGCDRPTRAKAPDAFEWEKKELAKKQEAQQLEELKQCTQDRGTRVATYHEQMTKGDHWKAFLAVNRCAAALNDAELQALANKAETLSLTSQIKDKKLAASDRLRSLNRLQAIDAKQADTFSKVRDELVKATEHDRINGKVAAFNNRRESIKANRSSHRQTWWAAVWTEDLLTAYDGTDPLDAIANDFSGLAPTASTVAERLG